MVDFRASRLERLAAAAQELAANAFHGEPSATGWINCDEPHCGGSWWGGSDWSPELGGMRKPPQLKEDSVEEQEATEGALPRDPYQAKGLVERRLLEQPQEMLRYTAMEFNAPLDHPLAKQVELHPAPVEKFALEMLPGTRDHLSTQVAEVDEMKKLLQNLTPFMRLHTEVKLGGKTIPKGLQLLAIKPKERPIRLRPALSPDDPLLGGGWQPSEVTFGKPPEEVEVKTMEQAPPLPKPRKPVIEPVSRLDVVLRKPREGLQDFLPPLLQAVE